MNIYFVPLVISVLISFHLVYAGRQVSSRDWPQYEHEQQDDQPEYEVIPLPKLTWSCDFKSDDCAISNDIIVGPYFQLSKTSINGFATRNMLLLNITQIKTNPSGARLITPYLKSNKRQSKGCLTIEYMIGGNGIKNLVVYQQEVENRCIYSAIAGGTGLRLVENWQKLSLTVDMQHGDPRYFIETHFDNRPPNTGFVGISAVNFFDGGCTRNDANQCIQLLSDEPEESTDYPNDLP